MTYEPCVLGADGQCSRWSHDHDSPAEPEPERVTVQYDLPGTHPVITVGISDRARVLIGERIGDSRDPRAGVNWITRLGDDGSVDGLQQVLEQVRADQARIARQVYPSDLRTALRAELARRAGRLATLPELEILHTGTHRNDLIAELARMRDDGEVRFMGARYWLTEKTVQP